MTQTEYKQKRSECWEKFKRENLDGEVQWQPVSRYDVFCDAFDRAFTLGKQEKDADTGTVISGWAARDEDGNLFMYSTKPERDETIQMWMGGCVNFGLRNHLFPDLTWESDPELVEIIIKRKKK